MKIKIRASSFSDAIIWTSLRRWLIYFQEANFKHYLWVIPLVGIVLSFVNKRLGTRVWMPEIAFNLFMIALLYGAAQVLYLLYCPREIKGIASIEEWRERILKKKQAVTTSLNTDIEMRGVVDRFIDQEVDRYLEKKLLTDKVPEGQKRAIKAAFKDRMSKNFDPVGSYLESLSESLHGNLADHNIANTSARIICSFCIFLSVAWSGIEIAEKLLWVLSTTFDLS